MLIDKGVQNITIQYNNDSVYLLTFDFENKIKFVKY